MTAYKKRSLLILTVVILVIAIVLSSFVYLNSQKPYAGNPESVTIGIVPHEYNSLIYIANEQKYFEANGLDVTLKNYDSGPAAINGILNSESDISTASEFAFVNEAIQNVSIYSFSSVSKSLILYLVARNDHGINSISDLKGKTIGVSIGTAEQFYLGRFLDLQGISQSQVILRNMTFAEHPIALANGTVDAVITFQPYIGQIKNLLGDKIVMWSAQSDQFQFDEAICTRTWAVMHPDLIVRFLKALVQAETFTTNHPDQAMNIVAKKLNYNSSYITSVWPDYQFSVTLDQTLILLMEDESRWLISNNLNSATFVPNFLNYVYVDGLKSVRPESVNIIGVDS